MVYSNFYDIAPHRGFLPAVDPPDVLPEPYTLVDAVADEIPARTMKGTFREYIHSIADSLGALGVPATLDKLSLANGELDRVHSALSFISVAYLRGDFGAPQRTSLPPCLSVPWEAVSNRVGRRPMLDYADCILTNWRPLPASAPPPPSLMSAAAGDPFVAEVPMYGSPSREEAEKVAALASHRMVMRHRFTGLADEEGFYRVHVAIEASAACAATACYEAASLPPLTAESFAAYERVLKGMGYGLRALGGGMKAMYHSVDYDLFFHRIRPFISGFTDSPVILEGVAAEGGGAGWRVMQDAGPSGGQSGLIPFVDKVLGVSAPGAAAASVVSAFFPHIPSPHRKAIEGLASRPSIHEALSTATGLSPVEAKVLVSHYNAAVSALADFRSKHFHVIKKFIFEPASYPPALAPLGSPFAPRAASAAAPFGAPTGGAGGDAQAAPAAAADAGGGGGGGERSPAASSSNPPAGSSASSKAVGSGYTPVGAAGSGAGHAPAADLQAFLSEAATTLGALLAPAGSGAIRSADAAPSALATLAAAPRLPSGVVWGPRALTAQTALPAEVAGDDVGGVAALAELIPALLPGRRLVGAVIAARRAIESCAARAPALAVGEAERVHTYAAFLAAAVEWELGGVGVAPLAKGSWEGAPKDAAVAAEVRGVLQPLLSAVRDRILPRRPSPHIPLGLTELVLTNADFAPPGGDALPKLDDIQLRCRLVCSVEEDYLLRSHAILSFAADAVLASAAACRGAIAKRDAAAAVVAFYAMAAALSRLSGAHVLPPNERLDKVGFRRILPALLPPPPLPGGMPLGEWASGLVYVGLCPVVVAVDGVVGVEPMPPDHPYSVCAAEHVAALPAPARAEIQACGAICPTAVGALLAAAPPAVRQQLSTARQLALDEVRRLHSLRRGLVLRLLAPLVPTLCARAEHVGLHAGGAAERS